MQIKTHFPALVKRFAAFSPFNFAFVHVFPDFPALRAQFFAVFPDIAPFLRIIRF